MDDSPPRRRDTPQIILWVLLGGAASLAVLIGGAIFAYMMWRSSSAQVRPQKVSVAPPVAEAPEVIPANIKSNPPVIVAQDGDFSSTNSVTSLLGEDEAGHGLAHIDNRKDGPTTIETINGVPARVARLADNRTELFFYFQINPTFKKQDLRQVKFEVEYFAPQPGTMNIHYNARSGPNVENPNYRETVGTIRLANSGRWEKATFFARNDAAFRNRQNGKSDFRIVANTSIIYIRRVTVLQEQAAGE